VSTPQGPLKGEGITAISFFTVSLKATLAKKAKKAKKAKYAKSPL
jgi:hypothetical protein